MNLKQFKKHLKNNNGKILNKKEFEYEGKKYPFYCFLKDSKQRNPYLSSYIIKKNYKKTWLKFAQFGIIKGKRSQDYYKKKKNREEDRGLFELTFFIFIIQFIYYLVRLSFIYLICFFNRKNEYVEINKRIQDLNFFGDAYFEMHVSVEKCIEQQRKTYWSFDQLMIADWALKKGKVVFTLQNYMDYKKYLEEKQIQMFMNIS